jgi:signal transduction histidine kinase
MLQRLNKLASGWAGKRPHDLPLGMLADLTGWMGRFVERGALVAIFANTQGDDPTLYVCSQRLEAVAPLLARHVTQANAAPFSMPLAVADSAVSAWSEPLTMAGAAHLRGRLWAVTVAPLRGAQRDAVHEAAREVALALERERSERVWLRDSGIFRHALIGPIAGIVSAARSLARLAQASADKSHRDRVDAKRLQVEEETAAVRLWGDNQQLYKLYLGEKLDLTPHPVALGAILEACRLRFQDALAARRQSLSVVGDPPLAALSVDRDALELALANLLDNARKYALAGTPVVLHVVHDRKRGVARVTVEDQGNGIPESRRESIYQIARRHHKDPIRTIDGSGLGLPLARTIARAHGGDLSHTSDSLGWTTTNGLAVHRVRLILTLPAAY